MKISLEVRKLDILQTLLRELPRGTIRSAVKAFGEYFLGDDRHGLRHMVPYRFISRKSAYGFSFFTERQRRWFFANLSEGNIRPGSGERHDTTRGWTGKSVNSGYGFQLSAKGPAAYYTMGDNSQARQPAAVGHRTVSSVISSNISGALRAAVAAVNKWLADNTKK